MQGSGAGPWGCRTCGTNPQTTTNPGNASQTGLGSTACGKRTRMRAMRAQLTATHPTMRVCRSNQLGDVQRGVHVVCAQSIPQPRKTGIACASQRKTCRSAQCATELTRPDLRAKMCATKPERSACRGTTQPSINWKQANVDVNRSVNAPLIRVFNACVRSSNQRVTGPANDARQTDH